MTPIGSDTTNSTSLNLHAVEMIYENAWQYNVIQPSSGAIAFGLNSQWISSMVKETSKMSFWSIEVGNVADQSFAGGSYNSSGPQLFMGPGNYSKLYTYDDTDSITLYTTENDTYHLGRAWIGQNDTTNEYWLELGYSQSTLMCTIALNFQGLGLPWYEWHQVVTSLYKINANIANDLNCDSEAGGKCNLSKACSNSDYNDLWSYFFKVQFDIQSEIFTTVNLGSFAVDNSEGSCDLYI
jgi:hypothetical protein